MADPAGPKPHQHVPEPVTPWLGVTKAGVSETTLYEADPNQLCEKLSRVAAAAFADPADQSHPYASPVYAELTMSFPSTLIQVGVLLSGFVRFGQSLDAAGVPVKLDLSEGMIHNFPDRIRNAPGAILARRKMRVVLHRHLGL